MERLLQQPALPKVLVPVQDQDRMRSGERAQELPALARGRDLRGQREHLADGIRP